MGRTEEATAEEATRDDRFMADFWFTGRRKTPPGGGSPVWTVWISSGEGASMAECAGDPGEGLDSLVARLMPGAGVTS